MDICKISFITENSFTRNVFVTGKTLLSSCNTEYCTYSTFLPSAIAKQKICVSQSYTYIYNIYVTYNSNAYCHNCVPVYFIRNTLISFVQTSTVLVSHLYLQENAMVIADVQGNKR